MIVVIVGNNVTYIHTYLPVYLSICLYIYLYNKLGGAQEETRPQALGLALGGIFQESVLYLSARRAKFRLMCVYVLLFCNNHANKNSSNNSNSNNVYVRVCLSVRPSVLLYVCMYVCMYICIHMYLGREGSRCGGLRVCVTCCCPLIQIMPLPSPFRLRAGLERIA